MHIVLNGSGKQGMYLACCRDVGTIIAI